MSTLFHAPHVAQGGDFNDWSTRMSIATKFGEHVDRLREYTEDELLRQVQTIASLIDKPGLMPQPLPEELVEIAARCQAVLERMVRRGDLS